ncbi:hypothetical protein CPAR01_13804, partial [Colletotrichum paranaense]
GAQGISKGNSVNQDPGFGSTCPICKVVRHKWECRCLQQGEESGEDVKSQSNKTSPLPQDTSLRRLQDPVSLPSKAKVILPGVDSSLK